jgi:hypothetical protein
MLNRIQKKSLHDRIHLFALSTFAIGLASSKVILSLSSLLLLANLFIERDFKLYWRNWRNAGFILVALITYWSLHIIALIWTRNFDYAFNDLKIKVTLLIIPLIILAKPIEKAKNIHIILGLFICSLLITSSWNMLCYTHVIGNHSYLDIRELSLFGSHIRYGILIAIGVGVCLFYLTVWDSKLKLFLLPIIIWLSYYTYYSQIISGLLAFMTVLFSFILYHIFIRSKLGGWTSIVVLGLAIVITLIYFNATQIEHKTTYSMHNLRSYTLQGNKYTHDLNPNTFENGRPTMIYVCEKELKTAWEKQSKLTYDGLDKKEQPLKYTLIRYMASKNLKKDSVDFQKLTPSDIQSIENGIANVEETKTGFLARFEGIKYSLTGNKDPNGNSLLQRIAYWKTGFKIICKNWLFGVGTGDVQDAFDQQYNADNSTLIKKYRLRAHNSYLTSWISFGIMGLASFISLLFMYLIKALKNTSYLPLMFILVMILTFCIEDTLETQMGVSIFAFFYGLFGLFLVKESALSFNSFKRSL